MHNISVNPSFPQNISDVHLFDNATDISNANNSIITANDEITNNEYVKDPVSLYSESGTYLLF